MDLQSREDHETLHDHREQDNSLDDGHRDLHIAREFDSFNHDETDHREPNCSDSYHPIHIVYEIWTEDEQGCIRRRDHG